MTRASTNTSMLCPTGNSLFAAACGIWYTPPISEVIETVKFTNRPYFTLEGNICALLAAKDHVNVFIYDPIAPDPEGIINQGHDNKTARAIQIRQGEDVDEPALLNLFKAVIANNRAGGWRKLKTSK